MRPALITGFCSMKRLKDPFQATPENLEDHGLPITHAVGATLQDRDSQVDDQRLSQRKNSLKTIFQ